jgi:HSP20 family protein
MADIEKKDEARVFTPFVDIAEKGESFEITADVPGAVKDGVEIEVSGDLLTARIKAKAPDVGGLPLLHREYVTGDYEVSFKLSDGVDRDKIEAELTNGVLRLTLPKAEAVKPRQIKVKVA